MSRKPLHLVNVNGICVVMYNRSVCMCELDPSHVIGLYPNLLPDDFRKQLDYPDALPDLSGDDLERGILSLIDYLTQVICFISLSLEIKQ